MKPTKMTTTAAMVAGNLLSEISTSSSTKRYRFFLNAVRPGRVHTGQVVVSGDIREVGPDFVRIRMSGGYRTHTDHLIPLHSILYIEEVTSSSGGE